MILYWIYKNCDIKLISWKLFFLYEKLWKIMVTRNGFAGHSTASADWWLTHLLEFFFSIKYFSFKFHMSEKIRNIFSMFPAFPMSYIMFFENIWILEGEMAKSPTDRSSVHRIVQTNYFWRLLEQRSRVKEKPSKVVPKKPKDS